MSEASGFYTSRASSLTIFSGLGTCSVISGGSETGGQIVVDELSNEQLAKVVGDIKASVKRLHLETKMFEGYFGRLVTSSDGKGGSIGSRRESTTSQHSISDVDSRPTTAGGEQGGRRRRSGSRTASLGGRGKSLKITTDQKIISANRELELVEDSLAYYRKVVERAKQNGRAEIEERALVLRETTRNRDRIAKQLELCVVRQDGRKKCNIDMLDKVLKEEVKLMKRMKEKLLNKNGVLLNQRIKISEQIKQLLATAEVTGPVDLNQLHLENIHLTGVLFQKNRKITKRRNDIYSARQSKSEFIEKLKQQEKRTVQLMKMNEDKDALIFRLQKNIDELTETLVRLKAKKERLLQMTKHYDAPTVDVYFELKVCQYQYEKREKENERKNNLERLKRINEKSKSKKQKVHKTVVSTKRPISFSPKKRQSRIIRIGSPNLVVGHVCRGSTFDIVYNHPK